MPAERARVMEVVPQAVRFDVLHPGRGDERLEAALGERVDGMPQAGTLNLTAWIPSSPGASSKSTSVSSGTVATYCCLMV
jgi:hypothetical protein